MADKKLRIVLELVGRGLSTGLSGVRGAIQRVTGGLSNMAARGGRFVSDLAQKFFFLASSMQIVSRWAKSLFDRFISGAGSAAKLEAKLKAITGSAEDARYIMEWMAQTAKETGVDFEGLGASMTLMAIAAKDATGAFDPEKFAQLGNILQQYVALRPDVMVENLARNLAIAAKTGDWQRLEMVLDVPLRALLGIKDAAEDVTKVPEEIGRGVTYIETGAARAAKDAILSLEDLEEANRRAGITQELVTGAAALSGMEKLKQTWGDIARIVGAPMFEVLNKELGEFAEWLQENPEHIEALAKALGDLGAMGLEKLFEAIVKLIESIDFEKLGADAEKFIDALASDDASALPATLQDIVESLGKIGDFFESLQPVMDWLNRPKAQEAKEWRKETQEEFREQYGGKAPSFSEYFGSIIERFKEPKEPPYERFMEKYGQPQKVEVEIILNDELLEHRIRQTSQDVTTGALDEVGRQMRGEQ